MSKILFLLVAPGEDLPTDSLKGIGGHAQADLVIGVRSESIETLQGGTIHPGRIYKIKDGLGMGQAMIRKQQVGEVKPSYVDNNGLIAACDSFFGEANQNDEDRMKAAIRAYLDALE